jgi:hypothetical protein
MVAEIVEPPREPLDMLSTAVDGLAGDRLWQLGDDQLLARMDGLGTVIGRLQGLRLATIAEVEQRKACQGEEWTTADRLAGTDRQRLRQARATVWQARRLHRFDIVEQALCAGTVTGDQAGAICRGLDELPAAVADDVIQQAQHEMVRHAGQFDPAALRRLANHLVEVVCPDAVEGRLEQQLSRQEARARRDRFFDWRHTGDGSVRFRGQLPAAEGENAAAVIEAYTSHGPTAADQTPADPTAAGQAQDLQADVPSTGQRRADAFVAMIADVQARRLPPSVSGDRPRAVVTMQYDDLVAGIRGGMLLGSGELVSPGAARRLACSGDLLPAVLGGPSAVLDVARPVRLFTGLLRQALNLRDGGCCFPGCDTPPAGCDAHHVRPWWSGGPTELGNGVLLCPHHHRLVEPDPTASAGSRWTIRFNRHQLPEVTPPVRIDPHQQPRQHARYTENRYHRRPRGAESAGPSP